MTANDRLERQLVGALKRNLSTGRPVNVPEAGRLLWSIFCDLTVSRTSNGFGANPISYAEIQSYSAINRWPLSPSHIRIIRALDIAWLEHAASKAAKTTPEPTAKRTQPMTPQLFDALFS